MNRELAIKTVLATICKPELAIITAKAVKKQPSNYSLHLLDVTLMNLSDQRNNWFTALAILCIFHPAVADCVIEDTIFLSGKPKKKKKEIIKIIIYEGMPAHIDAA